ncbi:MAG: Asp23/Gls24 family envelope stress response protein [Clostridia bacterium]|nr:Asp23/Gls24 family envelope stress response protein [Clostridia bacterium]MBR3869948.1 Asp23/Gls24 family envelope stress response protein [Clostridia bacterium]
MVRQESALGNIEISTAAMASIVGIIATSCYGVVGMAARNAKDGIVQLLFKDNYEKGIKVTDTPEGLVIDVHIIVLYEVNIPAITDSIVNKIRHHVEDITGFMVKTVNVFVDDMRI